MSSNSAQAKWTRYNIMWQVGGFLLFPPPRKTHRYDIVEVIISLPVTCERSVDFSRYSGFLHQWNWLQRYNWNIVESGVKHYTPLPFFTWRLLIALLVFSIFSCIFLGSSWPWSNGSWIYNYPCNQCLSPLNVCVLIPFMARCIR